MSSKKLHTVNTIGGRLRHFAEGKFGGISRLADALGISQPRLSHYVSDKRAIPPEVVQKLAQLGCDITWLMTGETREDLNKRFENMILQKARELREEDFKLLDYLKSIGVDTEEKARSVLSPEALAHDVTMLVAERLAKYRVKRRGRKK